MTACLAFLTNFQPEFPDSLYVVEHRLARQDREQDLELKLKLFARTTICEWEVALAPALPPSEARQGWDLAILPSRRQDADPP